MKGEVIFCVSSLWEAGLTALMILHAYWLKSAFLLKFSSSSLNEIH